MIRSNSTIKSVRDVKRLTEVEKDTYLKLLDIVRQSSDYGNALLDILGKDVYDRAISSGLYILKVSAFSTIENSNLNNT